MEGDAKATDTKVASIRASDDEAREWERIADRRVAFEYTVRAVMANAEPLAEHERDAWARARDLHPELGGEPLEPWLYDHKTRSYRRKYGGI